MSEEKFEFEAMFCGRSAQFERFANGSWTPVTKKEAMRFADKLHFKVRDPKGNPIDGAFFQAQSEKQRQEAMKTYAQRDRQAERLAARTSLTPAGKRGPVPHDEGYVQQEGALEMSDLPPAGFEYVEGAPKKAYKGTIASQRFDPSLAREISTLRLTPKDDPAAAINLEGAVRAGQAVLAQQLARTPRQAISRA